MRAMFVSVCDATWPRLSPVVRAARAVLRGRAPRRSAPSAAGRPRPAAGGGTDRTTSRWISPKGTSRSVRVGTATRSAARRARAPWPARSAAGTARCGSARTRPGSRASSSARPRPGSRCRPTAAPRTVPLAPTGRPPGPGSAIDVDERLGGHHLDVDLELGADAGRRGRAARSSTNAPSSRLSSTLVSGYVLNARRAEMRNDAKRAPFDELGDDRLHRLDRRHHPVRERGARDAAHAANARRAPPPDRRGRRARARSGPETWRTRTGPRSERRPLARFRARCRRKSGRLPRLRLSSW